MTTFLNIVGTIALIVGVVLWIAMLRAGLAQQREVKPTDDGRTEKTAE